MNEATTEAEVVAGLARESVEPSHVSPGEHYRIVVPRDSALLPIDLTGPDYENSPARKRGLFKVHDAATLIAYLAKHGHAPTEVWADRSRLALVAVINGHGNGDNPGWGDHRASLEVRHTKAWEAWANLDGKFVDQAVFAEHIEDRAIDIVKPDAASMLEIAQSISATIGVNFESSKRLSNGETQLQYRQTIEAQAGRAGQLDIPTQIELGISPFEGAPAYKVTARFRYRIHEGSLRLAIALERPEDVLTNAFDEVVTEVADGIDHPVFRGVPA